MDDEFVVFKAPLGSPVHSAARFILKRGTYQACLDFIHETEDPSKPRFLRVEPLPTAAKTDFSDLEKRVCSHLAGGTELFYPALGDPRPPGGAKVLLLTEGGVCVQGPWSDDGRYLGWAPLPKRNKAKEAKL